MFHLVNPGYQQIHLPDFIKTQEMTLLLDIYIFKVKSGN